MKKKVPAATPKLELFKVTLVNPDGWMTGLGRVTCEMWSRSREDAQREVLVRQRAVGGPQWRLHDDECTLPEEDANGVPRNLEEWRKMQKQSAVAVKKSGERAFDSTIAICAHKVLIRWWGITGPISVQDLTYAADSTARNAIMGHCCRGQLYFRNAKSTARGWWNIQRYE